MASLLQRWRFSQSARYVLLAVFMGIGLGLLSFLASETRARLDFLEQAPNDNDQFIYSQLEIELLRLINAMKSAQSGDEEALAEVRIRYDLFYSRIYIVAARQTLYEARTTERQRQTLQSLLSFLEAANPIIDGPDSGLVVALAQLDQDLQSLYTPARGLSLEALAQLAGKADTNRSEFRTLLLQTSILSAVLIIVLGIFVISLMRLSQRNATLAKDAQRTRDRLQSTVAASLDAVIVIDEDSKILDFSGAAEEIFGYRKDDILHQPLPPLMIPERFIKAHYKELELVKATGKKHRAEDQLIHVVAKRANGEEFPAEATITSVPGGQGTLFVSFIRDISSRQHAQAEVVAARDRAVEAEKVKSDFIAVMSHEMRTPLNGLMAGLELMDGANLTPKQKRYLQITRQTSQQLLGHVNDVLQIAELESGKIRINEKDFSPAALLRELKESNAAIAQAKGLSLTTDPVDPEIETVLGDQRRIHQILLNLLGNAIKFTTQGQITLRCCLLEDADDHQIVRFEVEDSGAGIAAADQRSIFEDFITLDSSFQRNQDGTGLGLSISRRLARAMGGDVFLVSQLGTGSRFWVELPLSKAAPQPKPVPVERTNAPLPTRTNASIKVLVVEDNDINRMIAAEFITLAGAQAMTAENGETGVAMAARTAFDLILMDVSMPIKDGRVATREIRQKGASKDTPILGLTAHAQSKDLAGFLADGMQCVLIKPVNQDQILLAIEKHVLAPASGITTVPSRHLIQQKTVDELLEIFGKETLITMYDRFAAEMDSGLARAPESLGYKEEIHRLAGTAGAMGAHLLQQVLAEIAQTIGDDGVDVATLRNTWRLTRQAYADLGIAVSAPY